MDIKINYLYFYISERNINKMSEIKKTILYYSDFKRRVGRTEHFFTMIGLLSYIVIIAGIASLSPQPLNYLFIVILIHGYWMLFANYASRIRDIGYSPYLLIGIFVPIFNLILFLIMLFAKTDWAKK